MVTLPASRYPDLSYSLQRILSPGSQCATLTPFPGDRAAWHRPQPKASLATPASDLCAHKLSGFELNAALLHQGTQQTVV